MRPGPVVRAMYGPVTTLLSVFHPIPEAFCEALEYLQGNHDGANYRPESGSEDGSDGARNQDLPVQTFLLLESAPAGCCKSSVQESNLQGLPCPPSILGESVKKT